LRQRFSVLAQANRVILEAASVIARAEKKAHETSAE